ncbi:MAG: tRNA lysidine(34) synthetase TilS [Beijerinckiaceae bacterium]|nr:tRNA lysidine(34) synthetase TilS [Beijerinckiaceae bacterium]
MLTCEGPGGAGPRTSLARRQRSGKPAPDSNTEKISAGAIRRLFRPWESSRGIVLAVSGGPDSVALMLLAAGWARDLARPVQLYAATVDHGLRMDSRREAETVGIWAREIALPHVVLAWEGAKPSSRIQERAREARYRLLFQHAANLGADLVMTAHHADDQAETILFRLLRGSSISGLAGMKSACERNGLLLARPLLSCTKAELAAVCKTQGHPYFEDPSNADPDFARTRMRKLGALLAQEGFDREALLRLGRRAARADSALEKRADELRCTLEASRKTGSLTADLSALINEPEEMLLRILGAEIELAGNGGPLRLERLEAAAGKLARALRQSDDFKATLGGTLVRLDGSGNLTIVKEASRRRGKKNSAAAS